MKFNQHFYVVITTLDKWNEYRRNVANKYFEGIKNPLIKLPLKDSEDYRHIYHVFVIR